MKSKRASNKARKKKLATAQAAGTVRLVEVSDVVDFVPFAKGVEVGEQKVFADTPPSSPPKSATVPSLFETMPPPGVVLEKPLSPSDLDSVEVETTKDASAETIAEMKALFDASSQVTKTKATEGASSFVKEAGGYFLPNLKSCFSWLWSLRTPLTLLWAMILVPKLILLWIFIVLAKPTSIWMYKHCPDNWKARFKLSLPAPVRDSVVVRDLSEGADQGLPFILFWMYLFCAPFAIAWIGVHWIKGFIEPSPIKANRENHFVFTQNKKPDGHYSENNFYYSRAFAVVLLAFFGLGIPSFVSYAVYEKMGIRKIIEIGRAHV